MYSPAQQRYPLMSEHYPYNQVASPTALLAAFLPEYRDANVAYLDLDVEARAMFADTQAAHLAEASACASFVDQLHKRMGVAASFGGYLEDRAFLWQGTYLGGSEKTLHLGIDFNVPYGAVVTTPFSGTVIRRDNDHPERWGWGPRIFLESSAKGPDSREERAVFIFAHLADVTVNVGDTLAVGATIGIVGKPPFNGDWFPHLHVQQIRGELFDTFLQTNIWNLDGYGARGAIDQLRRDFPDPLLTLFSSSISQS